MKYSVIIPVYKAENTLARCLDSILNQPHDEVEILLINDGSPDGSGAICEAYAAEHSCIRYFEKKNGGVSSARNLGLACASGEYVLFVDSDDYVSDTYFEVLDAVLNERRPDMLLFGYANFGGDTSTWNTGDFFAGQEPEIAARASKAIRDYLFCSLWCKVFLRRIIEQNELRFLENLAIGEDQAFIFRYAMYIHSLASISDCLYHVDVENQESLSRKRRDYLAQQLLESDRAMRSALDEATLSEEAKQAYRSALAWRFYRAAYSAVKELGKYSLTPGERRRKIREICKLYAAEKVLPCDRKCAVIALPVRWRLAAVIDCMMQLYEKMR